MANPQAALDRALQLENLTLVYQPIHDARSGAIVAAEALLRQYRESGELREAGIITSAAEEGSGHDLYALDSWTIRTAYRDAAHWRDSAPRVRLNVNLSPREFQEGHVLERLTDLVSSCHLDPAAVNLEITETAEFEYPQGAADVLEQIRALGPSIWLDDFGTGHSSLTHVLHFPLDGLKIPGEFVKNIETDRRSRALAKSLIELAHDLGMEVIAEGVEREAQRDFLLEYGCDSIQGFLFSRPMELGAFLRLIRGSA